MKSLLLISFFIFQNPWLTPSFSQVVIKNGPFWQNKPQVLERICDRREILVSVKEENSEGPIKKLEMQGVGMVNNTAEQAYKIAKNFKHLEQISDYIKKIEYNEAKRQLFMHSEAFNYPAHMWMLVDYFEEDSKKQIRFTVQKGVFSGMKGSITFLNNFINKSQIEFVATYSYRELPMPTFFVEFGLEVIIQKVAAKMRTFIESYKTQEKAS